MTYLYSTVDDATVADEPDFMGRAWVQMMRSYRRRYGEWPGYWSCWRSELRQVTFLLMADRPIAPTLY